MTRLQELTGARRPIAELEPIAVIDIGSNSVRLVVYEGAVRAPTPLYNEKVMCGLGRSVASTGSLDATAVERAIAALNRFRNILNVLGVKNVHAIATAAVREAENGKDFLRRGQTAAGCKIEVLSGTIEARLAALGILMGFVDAEGVAGDFGGGSLELIDISRGKLNDATTLPLGGLRLMDTTSGKIEKAADLADAAIATVPWLKSAKGRTFYAVGGAWRSLAKLHMEANSYPLRVMQGYVMPTKTALDYAEAIRRVKKPQSLPGISEVTRARRDVLPYGALVLERLLRQLQPKEIVFSVYGIREGLIYSLLPLSEQQKDPLLSFCEDYADLRARSPAHARELCRWTDALFSLPELEETIEERRLRHAACLLSDVGWRAHPDYRGEQSLNTIAHAGLGGVDHPGRIFLGLSIFYRHETSEADGSHLSERLKALVPKRVHKRARIVGAAVRAAHTLSIGMAGVIDLVPLSYEAQKLILTIPSEYAGLDGERLRRRFQLLASLVEKQLEVRVGA